MKLQPTSNNYNLLQPTSFFQFVVALLVNYFLYMANIQRIDIL
jgi:hypothetical protein